VKSVDNCNSNRYNIASLRYTVVTASHSTTNEMKSLLVPVILSEEIWACCPTVHSDVSASLLPMPTPNFPELLYSEGLLFKFILRVYYLNLKTE
jgi:hypothetical protein